MKIECIEKAPVIAIKVWEIDLGVVAPAVASSVCDIMNLGLSKSLGYRFLSCAIFEDAHKIKCFTHFSVGGNKFKQAVIDAIEERVPVMEDEFLYDADCAGINTALWNLRYELSVKD